MSALSKFTLIFCLLALLPLQAHADDPRLMGRYGDWEAYVFTENGNKVCYMASQPKKREGNYTKRGESFLLITHRPAEGARNVFSYITGYTYKPGSDASAKIGSKKFLLFTQDDTAWGPDAEADESLTQAIRKGSTLVITGTSSRGTQTTDTISLKGSGSAYDRISEECAE